MMRTLSSSRKSFPDITSHSFNRHYRYTKAQFLYFLKVKKNFVIIYAERLSEKIVKNHWRPYLFGHFDSFCFTYCVIARKRDFHLHFNPGFNLLPNYRFTETFKAEISRIVLMVKFR